MYENIRSRKNKEYNSEINKYNHNKHNQTGIPDLMKQKFEDYSGFSFDDVKVYYNSSKPSKLHALAYTQGNHIYLGLKQEKHLVHELGHVIQQKQGRVTTGVNFNGYRVNQEHILENDADSYAIQALNSNNVCNNLQYTNNLPYRCPIQCKFPDNIDLDDFKNFNFKSLDDNNRKKEILEALKTIDPKIHPETKSFIEKLIEIGFSESESLDIWNHLLKGKKKQIEANKRARVLVSPQSIQEEIYGVKEEGFFYTSDNDVIRNNNPEYREVARKVKSKLDVHNSGKKLALWSGGYDLSAYASSQNYTTLEESQFGKILDNFYISHDWRLIGPLWNIISGQFVEKYIEDGGVEFHVFIRAYDPASVLVRQEVDQIYKAAQSKELKVFWHCIVSKREEENNSYYEIDEEGKLSDSPKPALSETECLKRLMNYYERNKSERAFQVMTNTFKSVLASDFKQVYEHMLAQDKLNKLT